MLKQMNPASLAGIAGLAVGFGQPQTTATAPSQEWIEQAAEREDQCESVSAGSDSLNENQAFVVIDDSKRVTVDIIKRNEKKITVLFESGVEVDFSLRKNDKYVRVGDDMRSGQYLELQS